MGVPKNIQSMESIAVSLLQTRLKSFAVGRYIDMIARKASGNILSHVSRESHSQVFINRILRRA